MEPVGSSHGVFRPQGRTPDRAKADKFRYTHRERFDRLPGERAATRLLSDENGILAVEDELIGPGSHRFRHPVREVPGNEERGPMGSPVRPGSSKNCPFRRASAPKRPSFPGRIPKRIEQISPVRSGRGSRKYLSGACRRPLGTRPEPRTWASSGGHSGEVDHLTRIGLPVLELSVVADDGLEYYRGVEGGENHGSRCPQTWHGAVRADREEADISRLRHGRVSGGKRASSPSCRRRRPGRVGRNPRLWISWRGRDSRLPISARAVPATGRAGLGSGP